MNWTLVEVLSEISVEINRVILSTQQHVQRMLITICKMGLEEAIFKNLRSWVLLSQRSLRHECNMLSVGWNIHCVKSWVITHVKLKYNYSFGGGMSAFKFSGRCLYLSNKFVQSLFWKRGKNVLFYPVCNCLYFIISKYVNTL